MDFTDSHATWAVGRLKAEIRARYLMALIFLRVLDNFYAEEYGAQEHCGQDEGDQPDAFPQLGRVHGYGHGQAAADQHDGINSPQLDVERAACRAKPLEVPGAIHQVSAEQPTEEHDFLHEEDPHAEARGFLLLPHVVEVVLKPRMVRVALLHCFFGASRRRCYVRVVQTIYTSPSTSP